MNLLDLSPNQLKRAAAIKEQIDRLNAELRGIFGAPNNSRPAQGKTRTMSAAANWCKSWADSNAMSAAC